MKYVKTKKIKLKRELGLGLLIFYGLGNIVGAGIYVLIGKVVGEAGSNAPLSFIIAAAVAALTAFSYAELSSRYPVASGASGYLKTAFGHKSIPIIVGLGMVLAGATSSATLINGMVGYIHEVINLNQDLLKVIVILALVGTIFAGMKQSALIASLFTVIELGGLIFIIILGYMKSGPAVNLEVFNPSGWNLNLVAPTISATFLAVYAYLGFEDIVNMAEDVKHPRRNLPLSMIVSLVVATILYILVLGVAMGNVSSEKLSSSAAPLRLVFQSVSSTNPLFLTIVGIIAAGNGIIVNAVMGSRVLYGLSEKKMMPKLFLKLSSRSVPIATTAIMIALLSVLTMAVPLVRLAKFTSLLVLLVFILVNLSLLKIKWDNRGKHNPEHVFIINKLIPIGGLLSSFILFCFEIAKTFNLA